MPLRFHRTCVDWPQNEVPALRQMIDDAVQVTRKTFLRHVDRGDLRYLERSLSYAILPRDGLTMAGDPYVTYHRSKLNNQTVYYFNHSAIEYVFA